MGSAHPAVSFRAPSLLTTFCPTLLLCHTAAYCEFSSRNHIILRSSANLCPAGALPSSTLHQVCSTVAYTVLAPLSSALRVSVCYVLLVAFLYTQASNFLLHCSSPASPRLSNSRFPPLGFPRYHQATPTLLGPPPSSRSECTRAGD